MRSILDISVSERTSGERLSKTSFGYFLDNQSKRQTKVKKYNDDFVKSWQNCWQHSKTFKLAWMKNLKIAIFPFKTDILQEVAFLVFLGIASSIWE